MPHHKIGAVLQPDRYSVIRAAIVDNQHLDAVDARNRARDILNHRCDCVGLIQHWDLYDQFHRSSRWFAEGSVMPRSLGGVLHGWVRFRDWPAILLDPP